MTDIKRQAARDARDAEKDRQAAESVTREFIILQADTMTSMLPGQVGAAISALFKALKPTRMEDGHLSHPVVGRSSDEIVAIAVAPAEHGWASVPQRWVMGTNGSDGPPSGDTMTEKASGKAFGDGLQRNAKPLRTARPSKSWTATTSSTPS